MTDEGVLLDRNAIEDAFRRLGDRLERRGVVADLYSEPRPVPHDLGEAELNTIGYVASQYGRLTGSQLERLTHTEQPWQAADARRKVGDSDRVELEWIGRHFRAEAAASEDDNGGLDPSAISACAPTSYSRRREPSDATASPR
jgi:hypothetical protein